jgi:hypothetical protein
MRCLLRRHINSAARTVRSTTALAARRDSPAFNNRLDADNSFAERAGRIRTAGAAGKNEEAIRLRPRFKIHRRLPLVIADGQHRVCQDGPVIEIA